MNLYFAYESPYLFKSFSCVLESLGQNEIWKLNMEHSLKFEN